LDAPCTPPVFAPGAIGLIMDGEGPRACQTTLKGREHKGIIALPKAAREWLASQAVERAAGVAARQRGRFPSQNCDLADRRYRQSKKPVLSRSSGGFAGPEQR